MTRLLISTFKNLRCSKDHGRSSTKTLREPLLEIKKSLKKLKDPVTLFIKGIHQVQTTRR